MPQPLVVGIVIIAALAVCLALAAAVSIKNVPKWARMVVFRRGRTGRDLVFGPGRHLVVPILDGSGVVVGLYGRKVAGPAAKLPEDSARHIYLKGEHRAAFNNAFAPPGWLLEIPHMPPLPRPGPRFVTGMLDPSG